MSGVNERDRASVGRRRAERNTVTMATRLVDQRRGRLQLNDGDVDRIRVWEGSDDAFMACLTQYYLVGFQAMEYNKEAA